MEHFVAGPGNVRQPPASLTPRRQGVAQGPVRQGIGATQRGPARSLAARCQTDIASGREGVNGRYQSEGESARTPSRLSYQFPSRRNAVKLSVKRSGAVGKLASQASCASGTIHETGEMDYLPSVSRLAGHCCGDARFGGGFHLDCHGDGEKLNPYASRTLLQCQNIFQKMCPSLSSAWKFVCRLIEGPLRRPEKQIKTTTKQHQI
jgi:hypothetical protein